MIKKNSNKKNEDKNQNKINKLKDNYQFFIGR